MYWPLTSGLWSTTGALSGSLGATFTAGAVAGGGGFFGFGWK